VLKTRKLLIFRSPIPPLVPLKSPKPQFCGTPVAHRQFTQEMFRPSLGNPVKEKSRRGAGVKWTKHESTILKCT